MNAFTVADRLNSDLIRQGVVSEPRLAIDHRRCAGLVVHIWRSPAGFGSQQLRAGQACDITGLLGNDHLDFIGPAAALEVGL